MMALRSIFLFFKEGLNLAAIGKTFEGYLIKSHCYFARLHHAVLQQATARVLIGAANKIQTSE